MSSSCKTKDGASEKLSRSVRCRGSFPPSSVVSCGDAVGFKTVIGKSMRSSYFVEWCNRSQFTLTIRCNLFLFTPGNIWWAIVSLFLQSVESCFGQSNPNYALIRSLKKITKGDNWLVMACYLFLMNAMADCICDITVNFTCTDFKSFTEETCCWN